ncbi:MAG: hypothetical protein IIU67_03265, partial [Lachnospiraceae bacterium]|nr:hypothetical protein [Lachnospiraceae bacterium]
VAAIAGVTADAAIAVANTSALILFFINHFLLNICLKIISFFDRICIITDYFEKVFKITF